MKNYFIQVLVVLLMGIFMAVVGILAILSCIILPLFTDIKISWKDGISIGGII